eukprot:376154_1
MKDMEMETRDIIMLSTVGLFGLLTLIIFILVNWTACCSKSSGNVSNALKVCSFIACAASVIMVFIDISSILFSMKEMDITNGIMINFSLPFTSFIFKLFVYFIFTGQFYSFKNNDIIYKTSKIVISFIYIFISISIICVLVIIILEPMIAMENENKTHILKAIYKWDFVVLNINEFILSVFVIYLFIRKLITAIRFEKISSTKDGAFNTTKGVNFVDEEMDLSYNHKNTRNGGDYLLNDHYEYNKKDTVSNIKETSMIHIMVKLVLLSTLCICWVELLFITLNTQRFVKIKYDSNIFEIVRAIESFCAFMACLCIYLHFASNFRMYYCCCSCCHNCCLWMCVKCVGSRYNNNDIVGDWNMHMTMDHEEDSMYRQMQLIQL